MSMWVYHPLAVTQKNSKPRDDCWKKYLHIGSCMYAMCVLFAYMHGVSLHLKHFMHCTASWGPLQSSVRELSSCRECNSFLCRVLLLLQNHTLRIYTLQAHESITSCSLRLSLGSSTAALIPTAAQQSGIDNIIAPAPKKIRQVPFASPRIMHGWTPCSR